MRKRSELPPIAFTIAPDGKVYALIHGTALPMASARIRENGSERIQGITFREGHLIGEVKVPIMANEIVPWAELEAMAAAEKKPRIED